MANIRTARRSGLVLRGGRMRRETLWGDVTGTATVITAVSTAALLNVTGAALLALRPWTIVRARGMTHLSSDQAGSVEQQAVGFGIAVVSDQAVAIGITAIPTPVTDQGSDLWQTYLTSMAEASQSTSGNGGVALGYDSRAMRKVEDGSQLVFVLETEVTPLTSGVTFRHSARVLIKLH